jgi:hypothetical protein
MEIPINFDSTTPAAPGPTGANVNVTWQQDSSGNLSGYVPTIAGPTGATGPAGATGATGATGPSGGGSSTAVAQHVWVAASNPVGYPSGTYVGLGFNPVDAGSMGTPSYYTTLKAPAAATDPLAWTLATSATASSYHQLGENVAGGGYGGCMPGNLGFFQAVAALGQTTNCRFWIGLNQSGPGVAWADTTLYGVYAAFRYSTNAGDVNFQCVTQDGSASGQTVVSSGVAADTAYHTFKITWAAGHFLFSIDGTQVADISTTVPANSTTGRMSALAHIDNLALTNNVNINLAYLMWTGTL